MSFMEWSDEYSVGLEKMDAQHRQFFAFINTMHQAFTEGRGEEELKQILEELSDYAAFHFQSEEKLLSDINYPLKLNHRDEHETFSKRIHEFSSKYASGNFAITLPLMDFMKKWLCGHILGSDKKYGRHILDSNMTLNNGGN